ncbi:MAG: hypothetical protein QNJ47_02910 [Nostocaceae cyanobacterium]|nr:hypothetical protein [Nostocaceae cyanobacterium]
MIQQLPAVIYRGVTILNQPPTNPELKKFLYIFGVSIGLALLLTALVYFLLGIGVIKSIPSSVIWSIVMFSIGAGILSGVNRGR